MPNKEKQPYLILSIFGLNLKTKNKRVAEALTKRIVNAYEIFLLIAINCIFIAFCLNITGGSIYGYTSVSFEKLTVISLLFAITLVLALFLGKRE